MTRLALSNSLAFFLLCLAPPGYAVGEPSPSAVSAFNVYVGSVESRLAKQHETTDSFVALIPGSQSETRLRGGGLIVERLTASTGADLSGALLHHWRGTAFASGAKAEDFERLMRDFDGYPKYFSPQVLEAEVLTQHDDRLEASMRVRQRNVITVVMDTTYDIAYGRLDERHGYSNSRSTRISEIESAGTTKERALNSHDEHGFLWRLNTYWSYEERDGGLYIQIESVSLTRSIPPGLGWAVRPFVDSVPRESLEFTLRSVCNALRSKFIEHLK
jgi:hypothetical protein